MKKLFVILILLMASRLCFPLVEGVSRGEVKIYLAGLSGDRLGSWMKAIPLN